MSKPTRGRKTAPYGEWRSPITTDMIAAKNISFSSPQRDGADTYWIEGRPSEGGRNVIVRRRGSRTSDMIAQPFNARTRVHEYGGGAYLARGGDIVFSHFANQRPYVMRAGRKPRLIGSTSEATSTDTVSANGLRFASYERDETRNRLIAVVEAHIDGQPEPRNAIGAIDLTTGEVTTLVDGNDFYACPVLSPNGKKLAWLAWDHPNMPWDGTELWLAELDAHGATRHKRLIAGGSDLSVMQPRWSPEGELTFVSEATGWWNLYALRRGKVTALTKLEAEIGRPLWNLDSSSYAFVGPQTIACAIVDAGTVRFGLLDTKSKRLTHVGCPYSGIDGLVGDDGRAVFIGSSLTQPPAIVEFDATKQTFRQLKRASDVDVDAGYISEPRAIEFPTENGLTAYAFYYPPANRDFAAPAGTLPPLLVKSHGGPTSAASAAMKLSILYWTSRGIGVVDVNYGGSTGFGRAYRQRLIGQWGVVDVDDCVNAARYLANAGFADPQRLMISGGSAGGFTTLAALTFRSVFKAGASSYGISDIEALARDTHKFESRYLESLIGPYPARRDLYVARSPIHFADRISAPLLLLQGLEDKVVPPSQSEAMFDTVKAKGLQTAYIAFAGEQHGFRMAENIKRALEAELYFYGRVLGFTPREAIAPVDIANTV
jgi:dipeptidyl aminopeptidase/acylaminoacyl peptidase